MLTVQEFYAASHWRDRFWATAGRPNPHRGLDVAGWDVGTLVPAWIGGTVVTSEWQSGLGNVCVVETPLGYAGVSHLDSKGPRVGLFIPYGGSWGPLGDTGSLSDGKHAHLTLSTTSRFPWTGSVINPEPHIIAARDKASTSGGGTSPLPATRKRANNDMMIIHWNEPKAVIKPGKAGQYEATIAPRNHFLVFGDTKIVDEFYADALSGTQAMADGYAVALNGGNSVLVPKAKFDAIRAARI